MKRMQKIQAIILCLAMVFGMCFTGYDVYAKASWTDTDIAEEQEIFSEFCVPKRQLTVDGKKVEAEAVVTLPDGTSTKADTVKLKTAGKYTITWSAEVGGKAYAEEESFVVHNNLCGFTSEDSSASYGKYEYSKEAEGLMVRLAEGDKLTLNEPVDFGKLKNDDWLIEVFATPDTAGYADFKKICFQFTDVNDPDVTLYFSAKQTGESDTLPYTYVVAGGNDQTAKGLETGTGKIWEEGYFGAVTGHSFGLGDSLCSEYCDDQMIKLRLDRSGMTVYTKESLVADLDSAEYFDTVWEGFPSGKAYLTVWAERYSASTANFCLVKAGGIDLTQTVVKDTEPPVITIDSKYETMPSAVKGGCYQYIPDATAKDMMSGACNVTTKVYYNYQQPGHTVLEVTDGTFPTKKFGYYAIVYEAEDIFGNLAREMLWIKAEKSLEKPSITLTHEPEVEWVQGEKFVPGTYTYSCSNGDAIINVCAEKDGKRYSLNDGEWLEETGTYHITYEVKDCAGQTATAEYDLNVKTGDRPVLGQDVEMPAYMVEETEYTFPNVVFYDYRNGKKEKKTATGKIMDGSGTQEVKAGDTYKLTVGNNLDEVTIAFVCENASYEVKVPVIKSWGQDDNGRARLLYQNFFIGSGIACEQGEQLTFKATTSDGMWTFANKVLAEGFSMSLQCAEGNTEFSSIVVELSDCTDPDDKLTVELPYEVGVFSVKTGDTTKVLRKGTDLVTAGIVPIEIRDGTLYVTGAKIKAADVPEFKSGNLYLSVGFAGAGSHAAFDLVSLNNHTFGSSKTDKVAPNIVICGDYGGSYGYQDEITLPAAVAGDVMNPNITFGMTVKRGDEIVKDIHGTELKDVDPTKEYIICADAYGRYNISYSAYESFSEKESTMTYMIHITDDVTPTVEFKQTKATEAAVGDIICVPDVEVSDNETKAEDIIVKRYIEDPTGKIHLLPEKSNSIHADIAGNYRIMVLAVDDAGNVCNESWNVTVAAQK